MTAPKTNHRVPYTFHLNISLSVAYVTGLLQLRSISKAMLHTQTWGNKMQGCLDTSHALVRNVVCPHFWDLNSFISDGFYSHSMTSHGARDSEGLSQQWVKPQVITSFFPIFRIFIGLSSQKWRINPSPWDFYPWHWHWLFCRITWGNQSSVGRIPWHEKSLLL